MQDVICVLSIVDTCLATKEHQQHVVEKLFPWEFPRKETSFLCYQNYQTHVIKLYSAAILFLFKVAMRKQSNRHVVGDQSSVC